MTTKTKDAVKDLNEMTRADFEALPAREWAEEVEFQSLVILPLRQRHDSGYRLMDFVAVDGRNRPLCRLSGCSDVIHIDGIGGLGANWLEKNGGVPRMVPPSGWSIDCLPASGLLRMWPSSRRMTCGPALSSFEVCALEKKEARARPAAAEEK